MKYISFHTPDGGYPALAATLRASLDRLALAYDIVCVPAFPSWAEGCRFKSTFILGKLLEHREAVVWLDVDTEVLQRPVLLEGEEDFAVYNWLADTDHGLTEFEECRADTRRLRCSGGVQKWGYTAAAIELLLRWIGNFDVMDGSAGDDPLLDAAYEDWRPPVRPLWLPKTYNRMAAISSHWARVPTAEVVIEHHYRGGRHRVPAQATSDGVVARVAA